MVEFVLNGPPRTVTCKPGTRMLLDWPGKRHGLTRTGEARREGDRRVCSIGAPAPGKAPQAIAIVVAAPRRQPAASAATEEVRRA